MDKSKADYTPKPRPGRKPGAYLTDKEKAQIRECLASGMSINATARKVGVGSSTVSRYRRLNGLTTTTSHDNSAGTAAWSAIAAQRRAERTQQMDELFQLKATELIDVLKGNRKYKAKMKAAMGEERIKEIDTIPAQDFQYEMRGIAVLDASIHRNDQSLDDHGKERAESMLEKALNVAAAVVEQSKAGPRPGLIQE
jgi:transposase-like protein